MERRDGAALPRTTTMRHDPILRDCEYLERQACEVAAFVAATKARWGENPWSLIEPYLHSAWVQLEWETDARWWEIRDFVREAWRT